MAPLPNPKHERFAQFLSGGMESQEAYAKAGYAPDRGNAARLTANDGIQARVAELIADAAAAAGVTPDRLVRELANIAFANAGDFFHWDADGVTVKPSDMLTRDQMAAVCQVEETRLRGERTIRVKLADKGQAIEKLMKILNMGRETKEPDQHLHVHVESPAAIIMNRLNLLAERAQKISGPESQKVETGQMTIGTNTQKEGQGKLIEGQAIALQPSGPPALPIGPVSGLTSELSSAHSTASPSQPIEAGKVGATSSPLQIPNAVSTSPLADILTALQNKTKDKAKSKP